MAERSIICGVDGSGPSLAAARLAGRFARALESPIEYVYVAGPLEPNWRLWSVHDRLAEAIGEGARLRILIGAPAEQLAAAASHAFMVVLGTRGRSALRRLVATSTATAVARAAAVPVVAVPPQPDNIPRWPAPGRAIVCGIRDPSDLSCAGASAWLARDLGLDLTLVHVVREAQPTAAGGAPPAGLLRSTEEAAADGLQMLDGLACEIAPSAPTVCRTTVVRGSPGRELSRVAAAHDAVLVTLGPSRHRSPASPLGRRSARAVLRSGEHAVMVSPQHEHALIRIQASGRCEQRR